MIEIMDGNIFNARVEALVNPVNCEGVCGAGLAAKFKEHYRDNYRAYREACNQGKITVGTLFVYQYSDYGLTIFNFPTKYEWSCPSRLCWIEWGLKALVVKLEELKIKTVAVPALGCGLGGLHWTEVEKLMKKEFKYYEGKVLLYRPQ